MITTKGLITVAQQHGATIAVVEGIVRIKAPQPLPDSLIGELKANRETIVEYLSGEIQTRLIKGHEWLCSEYEGSFADNYTEQERDRFAHGLWTWDCLERQLRIIHGYQACVLGEGRRCAPDAPVLCDACTR